MSLLASVFPKAELLIPKRVGRGGPVTVAYRRGSLFITIGRAVCKELGLLREGCFMEVAMDREAGEMLMVYRPNGAKDPDAAALWRMHFRDGTHTMSMRHHLETKKHPSEPVEHQIRVVKGVKVLVVPLPLWIAPQRQGRVLAAAAAAEVRKRMAA